MNHIEVVGLGALNTDNIYKVERILDDGESIVEGVSSFPGGSSANTIYGLAKLGVKTGFIGAAGDDAAGRLMVEDFNSVGVDTSHIAIKKGQKSGSTLCLSARSGNRSLYVIPGANNLLSNQDVDSAYINSASLIHISSFANLDQLGLITGLVDNLSPTVKLSFSPGEIYASMGLDKLAQIISRTNILFTNRSELETLTGMEILSGVKECIKRGCQIVAVTMGKGEIIGSENHKSVACYVRDTRNEYMVEPLKESLSGSIDSTGAGDGFAAGFIYGWLRGKGPEECSLIGYTVARSSITKPGARQGLPTPARLEKRYRQLYDRQL